MDAIVILLGSQPAYVLRDLNAGESQPYVADWLAESLSLHIVLSHEQQAPPVYQNLHQRHRFVATLVERQAVMKALRIIIMAFADEEGLNDALPIVSDILFRSFLVAHSFNVFFSVSWEQVA